MKTSTSERVWKALEQVTDPEIPVSLVDLGMIYGVDVSEQGDVAIELTFTSIGCPAMEMILHDVECAVSEVADVRDVRLEVVWSPPWTKSRLTDRGRKLLHASGLSV